MKTLRRFIAFLRDWSEFEARHCDALLAAEIRRLVRDMRASREQMRP